MGPVGPRWTPCWPHETCYQSINVLATEGARVSATKELTQLGRNTVYPKKYAHGFCFAVLCCGYTLTDFPISIRLTSLALWQSNDCPSASKATPMNMGKYFMWIHYERLHNHNKAKHNKTVCLFFGIYCISVSAPERLVGFTFVVDTGIDIIAVVPRINSKVSNCLESRLFISFDKW